MLMNVLTLNVEATKILQNKPNLPVAMDKGILGKVLNATGSKIMKSIAAVPAQAGAKADGIAMVTVKSFGG